MKKIDKNRIIAYLQDMQDINAGYIFGSFASQREGPTSDIDIAILLFAGPLSFQRKNNIILDLNEITEREVDCVELNEAAPVLQMQILKNGKLLFCKDKRHLNEFTIKVIRNYLDLKQIRKPIEDRLGRISLYG